jgi:peptide/nickel transport system permease protein
MSETIRRRRWRALLRHRAAVVGLAVLAACVLFVLVVPLLSPYSPTQVAPGDRLHGPSLAHPLGTDDLGRDLLSRLAGGGRVSLLMCGLATLLAAVLGGAVGLVSGFYRGTVDFVLQRAVDVLLVLPPLVLALAIAAVAGEGVRGLVVAITLVGGPTYARVVRAATLSVMGSEYIAAARSLGASDVRLMLRHTLPNALAPILVQVSFGLGTALLLASGLGFLGLGVQPPTAEWGSMLSEGRAYVAVAPYMTTLPGLAIALTVLAFNLVGDGLRDILDPRRLAALGGERR